MIIVTRINGSPLALNADLVQRAEATPDTVITLVDGTKVLVEEPIDVLIDRMLEHRAAVLVRAGQIERGERTAGADAPALRLVPSEAE